MRRILSDSDVQKIDELNNKLIAIEEDIYNLAKQEFLLAENRLKQKESDITDYELEVELLFLIEDEELVDWNESIKHSFS